MTPLALSLSLWAALTSSAALSQCFERILNRAALPLCTDGRLKAETFIVKDSDSPMWFFCAFAGVRRQARPDGVRWRREDT